MRLGELAGFTPQRIEAGLETYPACWAFPAARPHPAQVIPAATSSRLQSRRRWGQLLSRHGLMGHSKLRVGTPLVIMAAKAAGLNTSRVKVTLQNKLMTSLPTPDLI